MLKLPKTIYYQKKKKNMAYIGIPWFCPAVGPECTYNFSNKLINYSSTLQQGLAFDSRLPIFCCSTFSGWWFESLWKIISQLGWLLPIYGEIKKNPNHQPVFFFWVKSILSLHQGLKTLACQDLGMGHRNFVAGWWMLKFPQCGKFIEVTWPSPIFVVAISSIMIYPHQGLSQEPPPSLHQQRRWAMLKTLCVCVCLQVGYRPSQRLTISVIKQW